MIGNHKIIAIVAVDDNFAIGKNNQLLYNVPTDMKFFREKTLGNIVVYGLNTLKSFPNEKLLPNRTNIVVSMEDVSAKDLIVAKSLNELFEIIAKIPDERDVYICGGASIYRQLIDFCDEAYVTNINATTENADVFFPNLNEKENWRITSSSDIILDETSGLKLRFLVYTNDKIML